MNFQHACQRQQEKQTEGDKGRESAHPVTRGAPRERHGQGRTPQGEGHRGIDEEPPPDQCQGNQGEAQPEKERPAGRPYRRGRPTSRQRHQGHGRKRQRQAQQRQGDGGLASERLVSGEEDRVELLDVSVPGGRGSQGREAVYQRLPERWNGQDQGTATEGGRRDMQARPRSPDDQEPSPRQQPTCKDRQHDHGAHVKAVHAQKGHLQQRLRRGQERHAARQHGRPRQGRPRH